jgi:hypothetical protein
LGPNLAQVVADEQAPLEKNAPDGQNIDLNADAAEKDGEWDPWEQAVHQNVLGQPDLNALPAKNENMVVIDLNAPASMQIDSNLSGTSQAIEEDDENEVLQPSEGENQALEEDSQNMIVLALPALSNEPINFGHMELQPEDLNALDPTDNDIQDMSVAIALYDPSIVTTIPPLQSVAPNKDQSNDNEIQPLHPVHSLQLDQNLDYES